MVVYFNLKKLYNIGTMLIIVNSHLTENTQEIGVNEIINVVQVYCIYWLIIL